MKKMLRLTTCCFALFCFSSYAQYAKNPEPLSSTELLKLSQSGDHKTVLQYGKIEGTVSVPQGMDPSTVVVQVGAVNSFNQTAEDFFTMPDKQGHFIFENTFTVGSSVNLVFWDRLGLLNKRALPVYVSKFSGSYDIYLEKVAVTSNLATSLGTTQDFTKSGLCGKITGLTPLETVGGEVVLQEDNSGHEYNAKYFDRSNLPNLAQNYLSQNGSFCVFNVDSYSKSFLYSLKVKLNNGVLKTFSVYLPSFTFADNMEFDAKSALFRPVEMYSWSDKAPQNKSISDKKSLSWYSTSNIDLSTNADYSAVRYNDNSKNNIVYFPLSDEFLNIDYSVSGEKESHFFLFQARSSLFNKQILAAIKNFTPGQAYVDNKNPLVLKILDPYLMTNNLEKLNPLFNSNKGSLFLNLDTSDYYFEKKHLHVYLKNISGHDVSHFVEMNVAENKKEVSGFFYDIPQGLYQLFVTVPTSKSNCDNCTTFNSTEKLLWASLVKSSSNKTQVLSNISDNKILIESKLSQHENNDVYVNAISNNTSKISVDILPEPAADIQTPGLVNYYEYLKEHSLFYRQSKEDLCYVPQPEKSTEKVLAFMGFVPTVALLPPAKSQPITRPDANIRLAQLEKAKKASL